MEFAIVDIETTGGYAERNRIVEIAIRVHDGERVIDQFDSLINPQRAIHPSVSAIHGITDRMVAEAPKFHEIAKEIYQMLQGRVFVAHSVNFDYSFLKTEFESLGAQFSFKKLCTVRLSRKLFPGLPSYSLGNLCQSLGIPLSDRHRAGGDVDATAILFSRLVEVDSQGFIQQSIKKNAMEHFLPSHLSKETFEKLPEVPGVYYFQNTHAQTIYVGKAINLKKRIYSHFTGSGQAHVKQRFKQEIADVKFTETGNELVALLHEASEIKRLKPTYNRALKMKIPLAGIYQYEDGQGYIRLAVARIKKGEKPIHMVKNEQHGRALLEDFKDKYQLCRKLLGIHKTSGPCFDHRLGDCQGACCQQESADVYNLRVQQALDTLKENEEDYLLIEEGRHAEEKAFVWVEKGKLKAWGFLNKESLIDAPSIENLEAVAQALEHDMDTYRIVRQYVKARPQIDLIKL
ncbi:exonuclease domain-containing protein [Cytophagales bacterium LB-30]|uniref:Exonuclease domain-containing protein n=1 Tax=Shiella aurantiaca TaxID=3058365 RepID=A0ABT8F0S5_9BACT|nr:exonuclease domain-containing protein [Shiella aurantiaca]MDN4164038.1 exonuclease domain-containing protein [Shiella aurantiaca]